MGSHGHSLKTITQTNYLCSLHIGIRQGALPKFQGDLEAVASPRGSPQLGGGYPAIFPLLRFLYRASTGDYAENFGPGWHLSSPGRKRIREDFTGANVGCYSGNVLGPVPGVDVMAKRSQGWVKCEDHLPYYRDSSCSLPLPRLHDHNSTTREDLAAGAGAPGAQGPLEWGSWGFNAARGRCSGQLRSKKMTRASHL